jgi:hypothetical protein
MVIKLSPFKKKKGQKKYKHTETELIFLYDKYVVIDLSKLPSSYSKKRTYVKDGETLHYNFCLDCGVYSLSNYNFYINHVRDIIEYDNDPDEALQWLKDIAILYTDGAWTWFCSFNEEHPNTPAGNYM